MSLENLGLTLTQRGYILATAFRETKSMTLSITGTIFGSVLIGIFAWFYYRDIAFFVGWLIWISVVTFIMSIFYYTRYRKYFVELNKWKEDYLEQSYFLIFETSVPKGSDTAGLYIHPAIGIIGSTLTVDLAKQFNDIPDDLEGVLVDTVVRGGTADIAGIDAATTNKYGERQSGDVIIALDGISIVDIEDYSLMFRKTKPLGKTSYLLDIAHLMYPIAVLIFLFGNVSNKVNWKSRMLFNLGILFYLPRLLIQDSLIEKRDRRSKLQMML